MLKHTTNYSSINIPVDSDKGCNESSQYRDNFITTCVKELRRTGECICFSKEHLEFIEERLGKGSIQYERVEDFYYRVTLCRK